MANVNKSIHASNGNQPEDIKIFYALQFKVYYIFFHQHVFYENLNDRNNFLTIIFNPCYRIQISSSSKVFSNTNNALLQSIIDCKVGLKQL